jgi:hypothetical protein
MFRAPAHGYPANLDVGHTGRFREVGASGSWFRGVYASLQVVACSQRAC